MKERKSVYFLFSSSYFIVSDLKDVLSINLTSISIEDLSSVQVRRSRKINLLNQNCFSISVMSLTISPGKKERKKRIFLLQQLFKITVIECNIKFCHLCLFADRINGFRLDLT